MHLRVRFALSVLWLVSTCMLVVWLFRRDPFTREKSPLHMHARGTALELRVERLVAFPSIRVGATPELSTIPALGGKSPLQVLGYSLFRFGASTLKPPTNAQCMFDGPRQLEGVSGTSGTILAPHNNNTWVVLKNEQGNVFHPSERFCVDYINETYFKNQTSIALGTALQTVPPAKRDKHRCAGMPGWIGADCRMGTGEKALLMDCVTIDKIEAQPNAQCTFKHLCCHEIRVLNRPFLAFPNPVNTTAQVDIFSSPNGTPAVFTGNRYDEFLDAVSYAVASQTYVGYNATSYTPITLAEDDKNLGLWVLVGERPGFSPRDRCLVDRMWKQVNGSKTELNGSWTFVCAG